ncbi:MAG: glycerol-3-phosphate 1-O-acyltransferase PlsY [Oscillospiraceae bacterium]|nr:glycerol-3-phosphate 1-O-acyltransferase PlsY [Oscillospiraceae bacterium]
MIINIVFAVLIGYVLGSVPFALVVGKLFYKTDIRNYGSKNLGGGNTGRVLGKKAGVAVMTLDILKVTLAMFLASLIAASHEMLTAAGLAAAVGHCFPMFAKFKGGKAVATMYGFLFGLIVVDGYSIFFFLIPLVSFLIILYIGKIIALASMGSAVVATIYVALSTGSVLFTIALAVFNVLIIWRHIPNIKRIIKHEENKIKWM